MAQATTPLATASFATASLSAQPGTDEFNVLTACCAAAWSPQAQSRFVDLLGGVRDWQRLLDKAEYHGLIPTLFDQVTQCPAASVDQCHLLRSRYQANSRRALWFTHELNRVLDYLRKKAIPVIAHKGPALALALYGDVTHRQYRDLDLLVRPEDVKSARIALTELDYTYTVEFSEQQERAYLRSGYECVFDSPVAKNLLELQWRILPRFYAVDFDIKQLFERSTEIKSGDVRGRILGREDLLVVLCVHAAKHVWAQLSWLRDIAQLAYSENLNWKFVWRQAEQLGVRRILTLNLALANRLFKLSLPHNENDATQVDELTSEILPIIRRGVAFDTESIAYFRLMMRLRERRWDQTRFAWRLAATPGPGEWKMISLPRVLFPLYRLVRLGRLTKRLALEA